MLRRPIIEEPVSRLAVWSNRLALFALAIAALSVIVVRTDLLEVVPAIATFGAALVFAVLAILLAFAAAVAIWRQGLGGIGRAVFGFLCAVALLAYPAYLGVMASQLPDIHDVTTDPGHPPRFDVIARLRPRGTDAYPNAAAALQRRAYPDIIPLQELANPATAFNAALDVVKRRKWVIVDARPPTPPGRVGTIEAVARTTVLGLREDVVIRVSPLGTGSQVDIRSASRFKFHDFGSNASRVRALLEDIDDQVATLAERAQEPERKPPPRQPAKR
ncbi:MAG: hypothetical protein OJF62_002953 [Pseudolabrys sp.]|nr:hypothetical protein [Pseudolabrys sp.]